LTYIEVLAHLPLSLSDRDRGGDAEFRLLKTSDRSKSFLKVSSKRTKNAVTV